MQLRKRRAVPHRTFRRRLFANFLAQHGPVHVDAFVSDDGHNSLLPSYCSPSDSFFEHCTEGVVYWCFPPSDLLAGLLGFLEEKRKAKKLPQVFILLPEQPRAPWFRYLSAYKRIASFRRGSDLFRVRSEFGVWSKCRPTADTWCIIKS